jgi:hypothetical protein
MTSIIRNNDSTNTVAAECPSADQVRVQLQRILDSTELQGSARRRALLEYLVKETLADRTGELKGYSVALDVFGRGDGFDPSSDPVVRLEAGRLRRSLDTYYANTGRLDALRITIPKGAYAEHRRKNSPTGAGHCSAKAARADCCAGSGCPSGRGGTVMVLVSR